MCDLIDLWQEPIETVDVSTPRRHMPRHTCAAPEIEIGDFAWPRNLGPSPPDFLDHVVLVDPEGGDSADLFVANFVGARGDAHPVGNLYLKWNSA
jgi:hypothetical protein